MNKDEIRQQVWRQMEKEKAGRFPFPLAGRIPNFKGAEKAAGHIVTLDAYKEAAVVKVNPDAPQLPLRAQVLKDGKVLLIPTPRLKAGFIRIDPENVPDGEERKAASLKHMKSYGKEIPLSEMPEIDLIVVGSVAVHRDGRRIGKGAGFADREYAIIRELGNRPVPVVGTVHSLQLSKEDVPRDPYDVTLDWIATERELIKTESPYKKPEGILWERVTEEEQKEMPVLEEIRRLGR
ncbi:5-formyltetrahydrofolate cyclo-ligase [Bacillus marinisedimentorum]|uniref:5-formyltetrahydrofolate cyclo-ligase n=1 Tax=Bacillus marinisedimentorum TaxID=1821260 RepID=UPI0008734234|nr:5-formyltetrahydrofolate cyclo-ligase [Bacillus marinisedimentorum]